MSLRSVLAAATIALVSLAFGACSNQAEGERCDVNNNNDDCQEGLICKSSRELGGSADICCPEGSSDLPACTPGGGATSTTTATTTTTTTSTTSSASTSTGQGGAGQGGAGQGGAGQGGAGGAGQGGAGGN